MNNAPSTSTSLEEVLASALDDERSAEATYQAVIDRHGPVRSFVNIIQAERRHAQMVFDLMRSRGMEVPANRWSGKGVAPPTVEQACAEGAEAERENVAFTIGSCLTCLIPKRDRSSAIFRTPAGTIISPLLSDAAALTVAGTRWRTRTAEQLGCQVVIRS